MSGDIESVRDPTNTQLCQKFYTKYTKGGQTFGFYNFVSERCSKLSPFNTKVGCANACFRPKYKGV